MQRLAWSFDFHAHKTVRIGHNPDAPGIARVLAAGGVEEIITFCKCHNGFSYYPTRVGTPHPRMKGDPFGSVLKACRAKGIRVLAYVSFGIDGEAGRRHRNWIQMFEPGKRPYSPDHFISVCPFSPYLDKKLLPEVGEIIARYQPAGFVFDTMAALHICYCPSCRRAFRQAAKREIPIKAEDDGWAEYGQFRHDRSLAMIKRVSDFITARLPGAAVGFNQIGSPPYPEEMPEGVSRLPVDFPTFGPQSLHASLHANYGSTASVPSDTMPTRFTQGWGDWSPSPASALEAVAMPVLAHGVRLYMGDRLHPANRLSRGTAAAVRTISSLWKEIKRQGPAEGAKRDPSVLLLHGPSAVYGADMSQFGVNERDRLHTLEGAHRLLLDAGADFSIVAETYLENWLDPRRLLVVPEMPALETATNNRLERFLENGGRVLVVGQIPRVNGRPVSWVGVTESAKPWQDHIYLPAWQKGTDPVLVRGDCSWVNVNRAQKILPAIPPYDLRYGVRFGWGIGPAAERPAKSVLLSVTQVGKGKVWHLVCPIFSDYIIGINYPQMQWFTRLLARLQPSPSSGLTSEFGNVETITWRDGRTAWVYLINHGGEQFSTVGHTPWRRTIGPLPPLAVTLRVRGGRAAAVHDAGRRLRFRQAGGEIQVPVTMGNRWRVIRVDWSH